jgi:hypothetical protein
MRPSQLKPRIHISLAYDAYLNQRRSELESARRRFLASGAPPVSIPLINEDDREALYSGSTGPFLKPNPRSPR